MTNWCCVFLFITILTVNCLHIFARIHIAVLESIVELLAFGTLNDNAGLHGDALDLLSDEVAVDL